ncbi:MAG: VPLPA-CTERM sorting domain-containing protein [Gammaproteobacteria bacterium]|nr:VPLPA-CTERM sorting domain-containing protein [Gammaproteobacteria bacterium]
MNKRLHVLTLVAALCVSGMANTAQAAPVTIFSTDFDSATLPAGISPGTALLTGVQGYAGLGPTGNQFGGNFLRSATGNTVTLSLTDLPQHDTISLEFLFAAIDSLDGTGTFPAGDFFRIVFDGNVLFSESFANALASQIQSYVSPPGVELARRVDLGFQGPGSYYTDSAYNLGADPRFLNFAHTGSTAQIEFFIFGEGNQSLDDESWAMDNLRVSVTTNTVPIPAAAWLFGSGLLGMVGIARRKVALSAQNETMTTILKASAGRN